jgi:prepilin-type N-terminal cleavage/methylation domain-containing protein
MKKLNRKGFTLIELMIVIAIIAILAAILVPNFVKARAQGQLTSCKSNLKNIGTACEMYSADFNGRYPGDFTGLTSGSYMRVIPRCPLTAGEDYNYESQENPDWYGLSCDNGDHTQAGLTGKGYPQYDSSAGLIAPLQNGEGTQLTSWAKPEQH